MATLRLHIAAAIRYARVFPVPVGASITRIRSERRASRASTAIEICCSRCSYCPMERAKRPFGPRIDSIVSRSPMAGIAHPSTLPAALPTRCCYPLSCTAQGVLISPAALSKLLCPAQDPFRPQWRSDRVDMEVGSQYITCTQSVSHSVDTMSAQDPK